jgi:hypothetical protein
MPRLPLPSSLLGWPKVVPAWISRALTEYLLLVLGWAWYMPAQKDFHFWPYTPFVVALWLLARGMTLRRECQAGTAPKLGSWLESNLTGLTLSALGAVFFLAVPWADIPRLTGWSLTLLLMVELGCNHDARRRVARWSVRRWVRLWPQAGELGAIVATFWLWTRLTEIVLPLPVLAWIGGAAGAILVLTRPAGGWWRGLIAPAVVLLPVIWAYAETPEGRPYTRLFLLSTTALAAPCLHRRFEQGPGRRSSRLAWFWILVLAGAWLTGPLLNARAVGAGDAQWYATVLADAIEQFRAGFFPPLIGRSVYAFNGAIFPGAFAPYYQAMGVAVHALTAGALPVYAIQHVLAAGSIFGGMLAMFWVLRRQTAAPRAYCAAIAVLYGASPAWLAAIYSMDMYMTLLTMPWLPLVFYGSLRCFQQLDLAAIGWTAVPPALVCLAHPPIGLWTILVLAPLHIWRVYRRRQPWNRELCWLVGSTGLFAVLTALPVVSALGTAHATDAFRHDYVITTLRAHWQNAWLPVSASASLLSDQQLGWPVALLGLGGLLLGLRQRRTEAGGFLLAGAFLLLLLAPIPGLQSGLWRNLPAFLKSITDNWPTQRILPVLTTLCLVAGGTAVLRALGDNQRGRAFVITALSLSLCWNLGEAAKFRRRGTAVTATAESSVRRLLPENITLTRYAYHMFSQQPGYFSDGVMNLAMTQSLLHPVTLQPIATNLSAAGAGQTLLRTRLEPDLQTDDPFDLKPELHLRPGREYYLEFDFGEMDTVGTLTIRGERLEREYPVNEGTGNAVLGRRAGQRDNLTLWTTGDGVENVRLRFLPRETGAALIGPFASARLVEIQPTLLPVQVEHLAPFRATVRAPEDAWFETSRMFLPGYTATYEGNPVEVRPSPQGLALVRVPAGTGQVELRYRFPMAIQAALIITATAWAALVVLALGFKIQRKRRASAFNLNRGDGFLEPKSLPQSGG